MKIALKEFNGSKPTPCITDVGEIQSMTGWQRVPYSNTVAAKFQTSGGELDADCRSAATLAIGAIGLWENPYGARFCSDPRMIMMFLWRERQYCFGESETDPPIPTRKEAIAWIKEMDIPIDPPRGFRENTPKLLRNFLNRKD